MTYKQAALAGACTLAIGLSIQAETVAAEGLRYSERSAAAVGVAAEPARARLAEPAIKRVRQAVKSRSKQDDSWLPGWVAAIGDAIIGPPSTPKPAVVRRVARPAVPAAAAIAHASVRPELPLAPTADTAARQAVPSRPVGSFEPASAAPTAAVVTPPVQPIASAPPTPVPPPAVAPPTVSAPPPASVPANPIQTGALAVPPRPAPPVTPAQPVAPAPLPPAPTAPSAEVVTPPTEQSGAQVERLDIARARRDLPKLELASRVYSERKLAGERVFNATPDWVVLEHAHDAMGEADWAAARASGFEAVAYINDVSKTVVVAIAGTQDLRRDFITNDLWHALIKSQAPQQFYFATQYIKSVKRRYVASGYTIECVGHSLGGGACAYAAADIGIEARVVNPISAGRLEPRFEHLITNYVVDGDIASLVYRARGNDISGNVQLIDNRTGRDARQKVIDRWGRLGGIAVIIEDLRGAIDGHRVDSALDRIARMAEAERLR